MSQRVSFLICGAQKAGTTALDSYLRLHPDLILPGVKEAHFFDRETVNWQAPEGAYANDYHAMFDKKKTGLWGESTPVYMYWEPCAGRIYQYNNNLRMIAILRNPISRAYSHWHMEYQRGREKLGFIAAIQREAKLRKNRIIGQHRILSYVDRGYYSKQLQRLWKFFGRENVLVLRQEELMDCPQSLLERVYTFLGVSSIPLTETIRRNSTVYSAALTNDAKRYLRDVFEPEIVSLEQILGWDLKQWLG